MWTREVPVSSCCGVWGCVLNLFFSLEIRARVCVQPKLFSLGSSRESLRVRVRGAAYVCVQSMRPAVSMQLFPNVSAKKILAREVTQQQICIFFTVYVGSAAYVCVQCLIGVSQVLPMSASSPCVQLCPRSFPEMFPQKNPRTRSSTAAHLYF